MRSIDATAAPPQARANRRFQLGPIGLTFPAALGLLIFFLVPFVTFGLYSVLTGGAYLFSVHSPLTLDNYSTVLQSSVNRTLAWNSLVVGFCTAAITLILSIPVAYWLRYCAGKWQLPVFFMIIVALFASYLVRIYSWRTILGEHGLINEALERIGVIDHPLGFLLFSRFSIIVALVHIFIPYVVLMLLAAFRPIEPHYLECAEDLGASPFTRWRKVLLPLIAAPAATAFMFVFILSAADYVTPQFLGSSTSSMIGVEIQNQFKNVGNYATGASLAITVLVCFLVFYGLVQLALRLLRLQPLRWGS